MHCGAAVARHGACRRAAPAHGLPLGALGYFSRWPRAEGSCVVRRGEQPGRPWQQSTSRTPAGMGCLSLRSGLGECLPERGRHATPSVGLESAKVHTCAASAVDLGQGGLRPGSACQVSAVQRASINRLLFRSVGGVVCWGETRRDGPSKVIDGN